MTKVIVKMQSKYDDFIPSLQANIFRSFKMADKVSSKLPQSEWMTNLLRVGFELMLIGDTLIDHDKFIKILFIVVIIILTRFLEKEVMQNL